MPEFACGDGRFPAIETHDSHGQHHPPESRQSLAGQASGEARAASCGQARAGDRCQTLAGDSQAGSRRGCSTSRAAGCGCG
jgi:hypothetical protein